MRPLVTLLVLPALLLGACSTDEGGDAASRPQDTPSAPAESDESDEPDAPDESDESDEASSACDEVNAGINAFNQGDYDETVARFRDAVPIAEAEAEDGDSVAADELLEAVEYYAELAPEDYLEAARTSPDFAEYKAITLGQCAASAPPPTESEPPGVLT